MIYKKEVADAVFGAMEQVFDTLLREGLVGDDLSTRQKVWGIIASKTDELATQFDDTEEIDEIRRSASDALGSVEDAQGALDPENAEIDKEFIRTSLESAVSDLVQAV